MLFARVSSWRGWCCLVASHGEGSALLAVNSEVSQIENVDVCVNVDPETHPVGPTTPQKF